MLMGQDIRGLNSHVVVVLINICILRVFADRPVGKCVLLSAVLLLCSSIHFVRSLIDRSIGIPSIDLCPSIGVFKFSLIDRFGKGVLLSALLLMFPSVHFIRPLINLSID